MDMSIAALLVAEAALPVAVAAVLIAMVEVLISILNSLRIYNLPRSRKTRKEQTARRDDTYIYQEKKPT